MAKRRDHEPKRGTTETAADGWTKEKGAGTTTTTASRRKLVQALAASGVVVSAKLIPEKWGKPVVDSVALPAHAQTTGEGPSPCTLGNGELIQIAQNSPASLYERIVESGLETVDALVGQAWAGDALPDLCERLAGCYRIRFDCDSDRGTLFIRVFNFESDQDFDEQVEDCEEISAPFQSGVPGQIGGEDFLVTIHDRNSATLELDCLQVEIPLERNFNCVSCSEFGGDTSEDDIGQDA